LTPFFNIEGKLKKVPINVFWFDLYVLTGGVYTKVLNYIVCMIGVTYRYGRYDVDSYYRYFC